MTRWGVRHLAVLVLVLAVPGCDAEPAPRPPAGDLAVSATIAANEFGVGMVFPEDPPAGDEPRQGQDCRDAYKWAIGKGALLEVVAHLRITFRASRYTQVDGHSLVVRVVERVVDPGFSSRFWCDTGADAEDRDVYRVEIPAGEPEVAVESLTFMGPLSARGLAAGEELVFPVDVTIPKNSETTRFEVVLRADVNGVARTYVLRDGDRPFTLMGLQGGAGFAPSTYYWCPGSSGGLVHHPGDDDPLDTEHPPDPPC